MLKIANEKYLVEKELSLLCGLSVHWFRKARWEGKSPPYYKLNGKIFYKEHEVNDWFVNNLKNPIK